ncbi:MAG: hypothetical protein AVDCRST_MAG19-4217, partial [uncultured Thermomicrobiales bacterium]
GGPGRSRGAGAAGGERGGRARPARRPAGDGRLVDRRVQAPGRSRWVDLLGERIEGEVERTPGAGCRRSRHRSGEDRM